MKNQTYLSTVICFTLLFLFINNPITAQCPFDPVVQLNPMVPGDIYCPGDMVTLSTGTADSYQWYSNFSDSNSGGTPWPGGNTQSIQVGASEWAVTYFYVESTINACTEASPTVVWDSWVFAPPAIASSGQNTFCVGESTVISNAFNGPTFFQWFLNGAPISGATSAEYTVTMSGTYTLEAAYPDCPNFWMSSGVGPTFNFINPVIPTISQVGNALMANTGNSFQWSLSGTNIPGATSQSYTPTQTGNYTVTINLNDCPGTSASFFYEVQANCEITSAQVSNLLCSDNGTPTDPSDDTFTFDLMVLGNNTGTSWTATDPNSTNGTYNTPISFGPYLISNGSFSFSLIDNQEPTCQYQVSITPPSSCSDQCFITSADILNLQCLDNGTPNDPSDDLFTFELFVSGLNTSSSWTANDPNSTGGAYNTPVSFGPYLISNGNLNFLIFDNQDPSCLYQLSIAPPSSCSDQCLITTAEVLNLQCLDNGTPNDPSDDLFTFQLFVSGLNTSSSWTANDPNSTNGTYNTSTSFGPYLISNGNLNLVIFDNQDPNCLYQLFIPAPPTCSNQCLITSADILNLQCLDNGTPNDPNDDLFTFELIVSGLNTSSSWTASDPNSTGGAYNTPVSFGPYLISNGNLNLVIFDNQDPNCLFQLFIPTPPACSESCEILSVEVLNLQYDYEGTPGTASDDTFTFDLVVTGANTSSTWVTDNPNMMGGNYNVAVNQGPFSVSNGDLFFMVMDELNSNCNDQVFVIAPTCEQFITLAGDPITSNTYLAEILVESTGHVLSGTSVSFIAGEEISLESGFTVDGNTIFEAYIGPCNSIGE